MSAYDNLSLDDIIKMKRKESRGQWRQGYRQPYKRPKRIVSTYRDRQSHHSKQRGGRFQSHNFRKVKVTAPAPARINFPKNYICPWETPPTSFKLEHIPEPLHQPSLEPFPEPYPEPFLEPVGNEPEPYVASAVNYIIRFKNDSIQPQNRYVQSNIITTSKLEHDINAANNHRTFVGETPLNPGIWGNTVRVTNLRDTVTANDIKELFGEVGAMVGSQIRRTGTADIRYHDPDDAQKAVLVYNRRLLDGQTMNCFILPTKSQHQRRSGGVANREHLDDSISSI